MKSYKVIMFTDQEQEAPIGFYCRADDKDHAGIQANYAYPNGWVIDVFLCSDEEYPHTIHEEMEGA